MPRPASSRASIESGSARSATRCSPTDGSAAASLAPASSRSSSSTEAPSSASRAATARPMPLAAPVTRAVRPDSGGLMAATLRGPASRRSHVAQPMIAADPCVARSHVRAEADHLQGQVHVEPAGRLAPVLAEQLADPVEPLGDGVGVDVQPLRGLAQRPAAVEPGLQGLGQPRVRARVVVEDRSERAYARTPRARPGPLPPSSSRARPRPAGSLTSPSRPRRSSASRVWRGLAPGLRDRVAAGRRRHPDRGAVEP